MLSGAVARRYAKALLEAVPAAERERVYEELGAFASWLRSAPELGEVLRNPGFPAAERRRILEMVLAQGAFASQTVNFIRVLVGAGRLEALDAVLRDYRRRADEGAGIVRARVETAAPLAAETLARLGGALSSVLGRRLEADVAVVPALVGGVRVQVGDLVFDGSLAHRLARLRETLRG